MHYGCASFTAPEHGSSTSANRGSSPNWTPARCPTVSRRGARKSARPCWTSSRHRFGPRISSSPPLTATYIRGVAGGPCYLAISVHGIAGDDVSRDILLTDIFTAFGQRLAGKEIALQPVTTSWRDWSQRCAELAAHPAVVESRDFWLETVANATLRLADQVAQPPAVDDLVKISSTLTGSETSEIEDLRRRLQVPIDEILLAALARTIGATVGDGTVAVDLGGPGRSVLKPDVDLRRTVGWFTTVYPVALSCLTSRDASARQLLDGVHQTLKAVPHYGIGYGLLRYMYAPTARLLGATRPADLFFSYRGTIPGAAGRAFRRCSDSVRCRHGDVGARGYPGPGSRRRTPGVSLCRRLASGLVV